MGQVYEPYVFLMSVPFLLKEAIEAHGEMDGVYEHTPAP